MVLKSSSTDNSIFRRIRADIVTGRHQAGVRLVEEKIAKELKVSRTPVREALRLLESDGLVIVYKNRGAVVKKMLLPEINDVYNLRGRLEGYAAELAAMRATDEQIQAMQTYSDQFSLAIQRISVNSPRELDDTVKLNDANRNFHNSIVEAASHRRLTSLLADAVDDPLVFKTLQSLELSGLTRSAEFHEMIIKAIILRDSKRAGNLMREHISQGFDVIQSHF